MRQLSLFRKILYSFLFILISIVIWQHELIGYGISQGYGQLKIVYNAKPIEVFLNDQSFPDSLKQKLKLIQEIRKFAFDSLGIKYSDNYTTVYDQKGKPILWVVTACEPYKLKAKEWGFPVIGKFSYKGFFNYEKGQKAEKELKKEGWDTSLDEVGGWSTLGWFKDPVLTNMLLRGPGSLSNLIIHELTHGTLYVKSNVEYNENLASFVGDKGALKFIASKYGLDSKEYKDYEKSKIILEEYSLLVLASAKRLDSLYNTFADSDAKAVKEKKKQALMKEITASLQKYIDFFRKKNKRQYEKLGRINNTYFMDYKRYRQDQKVFEKEFVSKFKSDFRLYMAYLKKKYPSL